jgi:tetratricopeptide (TPR) repeat protein
LYFVGRREEARQVRDLLAEAIRSEPPTSSAWSALVSTDLRLNLRELALEDAAQALQPPAGARRPGLASPSSLNLGILTQLYDQATASAVYPLWPILLGGSDDDPLVALQRLDGLLHRPSLARLSGDERRERLAELVGLQAGQDRYRQADYLRTVGWLAARAGEADFAYRCRQQSVSLRSGSESYVRRILAGEAIRDQDWETAAQLLGAQDGAVAASSANQEQLATVLEMLGHQDQASKLREQAVAARLDPGTYASQAVNLLTLGKKEVAAERFQVAARLLPPGDGTTINAINSLGNAVYEDKPGEATPRWQFNMLGPLRGSNNMALDTYLKNLCVIHRVQARDLIAQGKFAEALAHGHRELDVMPGNVAVIDQVASLFDKQEEPAMADELFERFWRTYSTFCEQYPQSSSQRNVLARTAARAHRRLDEALQRIDEALAIDPERAELYATLAEVHLARGDDDAAIVAAEKGLAVQPQHPGCLAMLAKARGDMAVAVPDIE